MPANTWMPFEGAVIVPNPAYLPNPGTVQRKHRGDTHITLQEAYRIRNICDYLAPLFESKENSDDPVYEFQPSLARALELVANDEADRACEARYAS